MGYNVGAEIVPNTIVGILMIGLVECPPKPLRIMIKAPILGFSGSGLKVGAQGL